MSQAIATQQDHQDYAAIIERVLATGDLAKLSSAERINYYNSVCKSVGLNPLTQPMQYITLNGKLTLYMRRDGTDQLRKIHNVSIQIVSREHFNDVYVVTARATLPEGRADESIGAVALARLSGDALCNAIMKAETKAKRRVTLSVCGLGFLDESEIETIPDVVLGEPAEQPAQIEEPKKANGNGREHLIRTVTRLDNLVREARSSGLSNAEVRARMKQVTGKADRNDMDEAEMLRCIEAFEAWKAKPQATKPVIDPAWDTWWEPLSNLIRDLRDYGVKEAEIQKRMTDVANVKKRSELTEAKAKLVIEDFERWLGEFDAAQAGLNAELNPFAEEAR